MPSGTWPRGTDVLRTPQYLEEADHRAGQVIINGAPLACNSPVR
jgi:hypothetical protein